MTAQTASLPARASSAGHRDTRPASSPAVSRYPTTGVERLLLLAVICLLPLEEALPTVAGASVSWLLFAMLGFYIVFNRRRALARASVHPVALAGAALLFICSCIEIFHPNPGFDDLIRTAEMVVGAVLIAALCRDRRALRSCAWGFLLASLWLSLVLVLAYYGPLKSISAQNFGEASAARVELMGDNPLQTNLNLIADRVVMGAIVGFALALGSRRLLRRYTMLGLTLVCMIGGMIPMSRSAILTALLVCFAITTLYRRQILRAGALALGVAALAFALAPGPVLSRMVLLVQTDPGHHEEARLSVYTTILAHLRDAWLWGVGAGNYNSEWAMNVGITANTGHALGAHNTYLQFILNWGVLGLASLLALVYFAWKSVPRRVARDPYAVVVLAIGLGMLVRTMFTHNFYDKDFSLGLGLLMAARLWIWPGGIVPLGHKPPTPSPAGMAEVVPDVPIKP